MPISTPDWSALASENERLADSGMAGGAGMTTDTVAATAPPAPAAAASAHGARAEHPDDRARPRWTPVAHRRMPGRRAHRR
jgi:hypothetical protein